MHERVAGMMEKKGGNCTFTDWKRGKVISTTGSQTPTCGIKIFIFLRKQAVSSCNIATVDHSIGEHLLKMNKQALGWKISDLKVISPTICTHHIYLEEESKAVRQPQRRLKPHMQEVVRIEVLKLLQAGIIYPISNST